MWRENENEEKRREAVKAEKERREFDVQQKRQIEEGLEKELRKQKQQQKEQRREQIKE